MKELFYKYQPQLLKLANNSLGRYYLGISHEVKDKIVKLDPNAYTTQVGRRKFQSTFRCYNLFEKKLGLALKFSDSFLEGIKYYFTPQQMAWVEMNVSPETILSSAGDGNINIDNEATWAATRDGTTGDTANYTNTTNYLRCFHSTTWYVSRLFYAFDTSVLPSGFVASAGVMTIVVDSIEAGSPSNCQIVQTSQASATELAVEDFNNLVFTAGTDASVAVASAGNPMVFTLNATGRAWLNSTVTKLGVIDKDDLANTDPTPDDTAAFYARTSEYTGTTSDPKLVVTFSLPSADENSGFYLI